MRLLSPGWKVGHGLQKQDENSYRDMFSTPYPKAKLHTGNLQTLANKGMKVQIYNALNSANLSPNNQTGCQAWNLPTLLQKCINSPWAPWIIYTWPSSVFDLFPHSSALGWWGKIPFQVPRVSPPPWKVWAGISLPSDTWINMLCITLPETPLQYFTCLLIYLPLAKRRQAAQGQKLHVTFSLSTFLA